MSGTIKHVRDATANDSDKTLLTCPNYKVIELLHVHVVYISTATVGNRQLNLEIYDENNVIVSDIHAGAVQAASLTRHYSFSQGIFRETSFVDGEIQIAMPLKHILLPGWYVKVLDATAVAAAADDMTTNVIYKEVEHTDIEGL